MGWLHRDITSPRLLAVKGLLFAATGVMATVGVVVGTIGEEDWWVILAMHAVAVWAFCRAYYFAFYVIERYVEPRSRYAGLASAAGRAWRMLRSGRG
jgi:hypothetical protein